jgi:hypothetical protein
MFISLATKSTKRREDKQAILFRSFFVPFRVFCGHFSAHFDDGFDHTRFGLSK